ARAPRVRARRVHGRAATPLGPPVGMPTGHERSGSMNRQSTVFAITFVIAAAAVAGLVYLGRPLYALGAGAAGSLVHWATARGGGHEGEVADASYCCGFLLTLVFLGVGLYRIGAQSAAGGTIDILGFLEDLAAGLMLTVTGLLIRQVRTLAGSRAAPAAVDVQ